MIVLNCSTGYEQVDRILCGVIGLLVERFPDRVHSCYLVGSYQDGSATPVSDIDLAVLFKGQLTPDEQALARHLIKLCALISPLRLDVGILDEAHSLTTTNITLKTALVVYGEDAFADVSLESLEVKARRSMHSAIYYIALMRHHDPDLFYPLTYPAPAGEYFGYDVYGDFIGGEEFERGIRTILSTTTLFATTILAWQTGQHASGKRHSVELYREFIHDEWADYLTEMFALCKQTLQYRLPETDAERTQFRSICEGMVAFENHFLRLAQPHLRADLSDPSDEIKQQAANSLARISYPDDPHLMDALTIATNAESSALANIATTILAKYQRHASG